MSCPEKYARQHQARVLKSVGNGTLTLDMAWTVACVHNIIKFSMEN